MRLSISSIFAIALVAAASTVSAGPVSLYYLTNGDQGRNWRLQGSTAVSSNQANPQELGEYAIAVDGDVRTLGNGNQAPDGPSHPGSQYDLGFVYAGTDYAYPNSALAFYDGTTDGEFNYSVDYSGGGVYRMGRDWSSPVKLFDTPSSTLGITYDHSNNSIWYASFGIDTVFNVTMSGALLSSFSTGLSHMTSLALDHADGTLWMGNQAALLGTFFQYSGRECARRRIRSEHWGSTGA
jgi:hypothetical protein